MKFRQFTFTVMLSLALQTAAVRADSVKGIISLDLCTDWMLLKYADPSQVRAYSPLLYRYQADWVPDGLPIHDGSLEHILQLEAGLLISGEFNAILLRKRLHQLGREVEVLSLPTTLDGIRQYQAEFLALIDKSEVSAAAEWGKVYPPRHKSLLLLGANGIGTGSNTLEDDLLRRAGWNNYIEASGYVSLEMERIVAYPPDAIYPSAPLSNSLANLFVLHPAIQSLMSAGETRRGENWRWQCPGPWSLELIQELSLWKNS